MMRYAHVITVLAVLALLSTGRAEECRHCHGTGKVRVLCPTCQGREIEVCPRCKGSGSVKLVVGSVVRFVACPECKAKGKPSRWKCRTCNGDPSHKVTIPCPKCGGTGSIPEVAVDRAKELRGRLSCYESNLKNAITQIRVYEDDLRHDKVKEWKERAERYRLAIARAKILLTVAEGRQASLTAAEQLQLAEERVKRAEAELAAAKKALEDTKKLVVEGQPEP